LSQPDPPKCGAQNVANAAYPCLWGPGDDQLLVALEADFRSEESELYGGDGDDELSAWGRATAGVVRVAARSANGRR
jgi:hypothetical protein